MEQFVGLCSTPWAGGGGGAGRGRWQEEGFREVCTKAWADPAEASSCPDLGARGTNAMILMLMLLAVP